MVRVAGGKSLGGKVFRGEFGKVRLTLRRMHFGADGRCIRQGRRLKSLVAELNHDALIHKGDVLYFTRLKSRSICVSHIKF